MAKVYQTASGKKVDMDSLLLQNESTIAVGNQHVNARGDQLGAGGKVVKTRDQAMKEYYALNTPIAADTIIPQKATVDTLVTAQPVVEQPEILNAASGIGEADMGSPEVHVTAQPAATTETAQPALRGSLASIMTQAGPTTVTQKELLTPKKANGIQRF